MFLRVIFAVFVLTCGIQKGASAQQNLPVEVQADLLHGEINDALKAGDFPKALQGMDAYRKLGRPVAPSLLYLEARASVAAGDLVRAKRVFEQYFSSGGQQDSGYQEALALYRQILPQAQAAEEKAKAETEAAAAKAKADAEAAVAQAKADLEVRFAKANSDYADYMKCADCPQLVAIPVGSFTVGGRLVSFAKPFAIGRTEVTFAEWDKCVAAKACPRLGDKGYGRGTRPVINVKWAQAQNYAAWLSKTTGKTFRLPSLSEWAYAARAGAPKPYIEEIGLEQICTYANIRDLSQDEITTDPRLPCNDGSGEKTMPVGSYKPNPWGLYDLIGNVQEWMQDCWHANPTDVPTDGSAWIDQCEGTSKVMAGGGWSTHTGIGGTFAREPNDSFWTIGFRLVLELP